MTELSGPAWNGTGNNGLSDAGRDNPADQYAASESSGRAAFWGSTRSGGWLAPRSWTPANQVATGCPTPWAVSRRD